MSNSVDVVAMLAAVASAPVTDHAEREAILDAARAPVVAALGKPVMFKVRTLNRAEDWVFLLADMLDRDGRPFDYDGTPKAEAASHGFVSRAFAALLQHRADGWHVVENAIGPTDVAWEGWAAKHGTRPAIFRAQ